MIANLRHWLFGCSGHIEHEMDAQGIWWIGLRCRHCGEFKSPMLSMVQDTRPLDGEPG